MKTIFVVFLLITIYGFCNSEKIMTTNNKKDFSVNSEKFELKSDTTELSCKLTSKELQERKATVIASLKKQVLEKEELQNGFAFRFSGTEKIMDELIEFVKTERLCCDFFTFTLTFSGDGSKAWLELTGPDGTKDFILTELGM